MFSKILVATDLSAASHTVVQCAAGLRSLGAKDCLLLQCMNLGKDVSAGMDQAKNVLEQSLLDQKAVLEKSGLRVQMEVVPGFAQVEINRIAKERRCSLVVVGSHGHSLVGEVMLGGVASAVIHQAVMPVLIIRVEWKAETGQVGVKGEMCDLTRHLLFPTDFSDNADLAFRYVKHLAASGAREVTMLHVQDKERIDPHLMHRLGEFNRIDHERMEAMEAELSRAGPVKVHKDICFGHPVREILQRTGMKNFSLVVMGSQGRGFISELFLGSVSHAVARHSEAPVLLIPSVRETIK
jgi:nucleotide-binding universal stress UspA family protein